MLAGRGRIRHAALYLDASHTPYTALEQSDNLVLAATILGSKLKKPARAFWVEARKGFGVN